MLSVKQDSIKYHFWVVGIEPRLQRPLAIFPLLFCAVINKDSVSLLSFPFLRQVRVFFWGISLLYRWKYIRGAYDKFPDFFVWTLLLIVHTWNSRPLRSNLLRLQCSGCTVPTTSGRPHGSLLVWACQWPSSQPLSSLQFSHNDNLWAKGTTKSHREQGLDYRDGEELPWCLSWWNSLWQDRSCGLMHCPGGNATDPIWRVLASSNGISSWTPWKPQHSNPNPNRLANQLWCTDVLTPPTPLIMLHRVPSFLESLIPFKN